LSNRCELTVGEIAALTRAKLRDGDPTDRRIDNIAPLDAAGPCDITFLDKPKYVDALANTRAGACLIVPRFTASAPRGVALLETPHPYPAFVAVARKLFPGMLRPSSLFVTEGRAASAQVDPTARLEAGVTVDALAVIGPRAEIGAGTLIGARTVIGPDVCIGRECAIGLDATILHALIGDRYHPSRRPYRAGRLRLSAFAVGTPENPTSSTGHHPGRRRDRLQYDHRPRRHPRYGDRRRHQDR
jgi:UDP-3-O-[3-hydroxymyristoyl] glucosamine N-acyltransferase